MSFGLGLLLSLETATLDNNPTSSHCNLQEGSVRYSKIMVQCFAITTGRGLDEALIDLGLSDIIDTSEVSRLSTDEENYLYELLSSDDAIRSWQNMIG